MPNGDILNVIIDGEPGRIVDVMPKDWKGIAYKIGDNEYSKIVSKTIDRWCLGSYLYKIILENGGEIFTSKGYGFAYIV